MPRRRSLFIFSWFALTLFLSFPRPLAQQSKPDFSELEKVAFAELAESNTPGAAIGVVSGKHYADQLEERIFKPLGMARRTLRPTMAMTWPLAQGHDVSGREKPKVVRPAADNAGNWPAGSIFSSVQDLSRWVIALMHDGRIEPRP